MNKCYLLSLLVFALASCRAIAPAATTPPPAETASHPSLTLTTASPAPPAEELTLLPASGISSARLVDFYHGWAVAAQDLYWTGDAGKSWRRITPEISPQTSPGSAYFLDAQHGWLLLCEPRDQDSMVSIALTGDAGATWKLHELAPAVEIAAHADPFFCGRINSGRLFFLDAQLGWALIDRTETMNSLAAELYQTRDGGQTWQHRGSTPSGEFMFVSPTDGWMRAACCTGAPAQLYRTRDGGASWQAQLIDDSGPDDDFFLPRFYAPGAGILPVVLRDEGVALSGLSFFTTADGGETWSLRTALSPGPNVLDAGAVFDAEVFDERAWAAAIPGTGTFWTLDGGQSWMANLSATAISELSLGSPVDAWGLQCREGAAPDCVQLVRTDDGGAHWRQVVDAR